MPRPCEACPFTRGAGAVSLTRARVREVCRNALADNGGSFPCHKTTVETDEGDMVQTRDSKECAGSLLFGHKQGRYNQMARILGRIGAWNPDTMPGAADVFDSTAEMLRTAFK